MIFLHISILLHSLDKEKVFIIVDECKSWEKNRILDDQYFFTFNNEVCCVSPYYSIQGKDSLASVKLFNVDINLNPAETLEISLTEMLNTGAKFSSAMSYEDWYAINSEEADLYIILPDDFCSIKRFNYNEVFTVYKVNLVTESYYTYQDIPHSEGDYKRFFNVDNSMRNKDLDN